MTFSVDGLVNGDTKATALTTNPVLATIAVKTSPVGSYPITLTGGTSDNYDAHRATDSMLEVVYGWAGFLQPINDTAHQTGVTESKFKLGQTIPVKFQITDAAGTVVQQTGNPTFSRTDYLGACDATAALDTLPSVTADNGAAFSSNGIDVQLQLEHEGHHEAGRVPDLREPGGQHPSVGGHLPDEVASPPL